MENAKTDSEPNTEVGDRRQKNTSNATKTRTHSDRRSRLRPKLENPEEKPTPTSDPGATRNDTRVKKKEATIEHSDEKSHKVGAH